MLAIACGYEDADDLDHLRTDTGFKLACGRLPDGGAELCSQPTVSRVRIAFAAACPDAALFAAWLGACNPWDPDRRGVCPKTARS